MALPRTVILSILALFGCGFIFDRHVIYQEFTLATSYIHGVIDYHTKPDYQVMRAYRISKLTDEEIRAARAQAATKVTDWLAQRKYRRDKETREYAEKVLQCGDIVFKERHDWCSDYTGGELNAGDPIEPPYTLDDAYEYVIMQPCLGIQTTAEAMEAGCLPKSSQ